MASHALSGRKEKEGNEEKKANHCRVTGDVSLQSKKERRRSSKTEDFIIIHTRLVEGLLEDDG